MRWGADYLMKCHTERNVFYVQVSDKQGVGNPEYFKNESQIPILKIMSGIVGFTVLIECRPLRQAV